jgi:hypothetical protein
MATFDYATYHNLKPYEWTIIMNGGNQYLENKIFFTHKFL